MEEEEAREEKWEQNGGKKLHEEEVEMEYM